MKVYQRIASLIAARLNCEKSGNEEWLKRHTERLHYITENIMPSGSGFDSGTAIDIDSSGPERIVLHTSFHHMNEHGYYDGWTDHTITVKPSLLFGFNLRITGQNHNDIKEYIHQTFEFCLSEESDDAA